MVKFNTTLGNKSLSHQPQESDILGKGRNGWRERESKFVREFPSIFSTHTNLLVKSNVKLVKLIIAILVKYFKINHYADAKGNFQNQYITYMYLLKTGSEAI